MPPARSRRVQAQRKFAQGAYVPPNVAAAAVADNRRDTTQDRRNVTINNMSATGLLDVVSLQSHSHLTSQPVVIIERLSERNSARDEPPPSRSETVEPRHSEYPHERVNNNQATTKIPAKSPKFKTTKKKKVYKRVHHMSLRCRPQTSKPKLYKVIAGSCAPRRKVASKRQENSSDEDEPLIFQKTRQKHTAKQPSTSKQTGAGESAPEGKTPKPNPPKKKSSKKKRCKKRTNKITTEETLLTKEITTSNTSTKKITTNKSFEAPVTELHVTENSTDEKVTPLETLTEEIAISETSTKKISKNKIIINTMFETHVKIYSVDEMDTSVNSVIEVDPMDELTADVLGNLFSPGVPVATDDPVVLPVPVMQDGLEVPMMLDIDEKSSALDKVLAEFDDVFLEERSVSECGETILLQHTKLLDYDPVMVNDDVPKVPVDVLMGNDDVMEVSGDVPMVSGKVPGVTDDPDVPLNNSITMNEDEMVQINVIDRPAITRLRKASPEPGPSGMHDAIYSDQQIFLESPEPDEPIFIRILQNTAANLERAGNVQFEVPTTCVTEELRSDVDVINTSQELLDSRCKVCKPCTRIGKLLKVSSLLKSQIELTRKGQENNAAVLENEPTEREGETEDVEMDNEDADSMNDNQGYVYLRIPNHPLMLKLRNNTVLGKKFMGVCWGSRDEKNKPKFSLEGGEHLLDQLIKTLENTEGRSNTLEQQNGILESISISSDSSAEMSDATSQDQDTPIRLTAEKRKLHPVAVKKKLAEAKLKHDLVRKEKEKEIARIAEENRQELSRITAEKNIVSRYQERLAQMAKEKERDFARLKVEMRAEVMSKIEARRRMCAEVDSMAATLANEKDAKKMDPEELSDQDAPGTSCSLLTTNGGLLVDAPVYHPSEIEFRDPLRYYDKIWTEAVKYGICKVVPPPGWKPPFRVHDEMRFDVTNQYISRLFSRWGPAARELCAIKLSLAQQKVNFTRAPLLDGVEVNLPKLYHLVQRHGGLETVYNKKRWGKVAEDMKFNKGPNTERKLDQIYVKYLLPYDTLSHQERQDITQKVENAWNRKNQKLLDRAVNPLNRQKRLLGLMDSSDDETEDEDTMAAVNEAEDCIIKGAVMNRAKFKKIATMTYENTFGQASEFADPPDLTKIEKYYWRLVTLGTEHVCVHTAAIDTGEEGYGFIKNKSDSYGRHPWNPKVVSQNPRNVLQYLGPVLGVTVPTLLLGMLFSTSCWHKDPHAVNWLEYQLLGPERIWYGIPADQAHNFREAVEYLCPTFCQNKGLWLSTDITMIPPDMLREHNVTLSRVTQREGEYILAFPNAYTCCISTGYTESESVYFAPPSWLESLWTVFKQARESCEPTMFALEHLLYNIGKDPKADQTILKIAQPLYDKMLREEVTNRQMLQERGLPFFQDLLSANTSRKKNKANPRDQDECEYCRATLYLSKVKGLTGRNTVLCLEHALKLLDTEKYKDRHLEQLQVLVHVSVKELNTVHDDMKRRLGIPIA